MIASNKVYSYLKAIYAALLQRSERTDNSMHTIHTNSVQETEAVGRAFATRLHGGCVVALFGGMGMGENRVCARPLRRGWALMRR